MSHNPRVRDILKRTPIGQKVRRDDVHVLQALYPKEFKPGRTVIVREFWNTFRGKRYKYKMFYVWSNSRQHFYPVPTHKLGLSREQKRSINYRRAVDEQVREARQNFGIAGKPWLHLDHIYPFAAIVQDFHDMCEVKKRVPTARDFADYHRRVARYQVLTREENLRKGAKIEPQF